MWQLSHLGIFDMLLMTSQLTVTSLTLCNGPIDQGTCVHFVVTGADPVRDLNPKGGDPPPSMDPKIVARNNVFCRRRRRRRLCFRHTAGRNFFCSTLCVYTQNTQNFVENSKLAEKHKKGYVATLPTSGPLLILPPAVKRWGSLRRQGLCSHLAHLWATSDFVPRSEAEGLPKAAGVL